MNNYIDDSNTPTSERVSYSVRLTPSNHAYLRQQSYTRHKSINALVNSMIRCFYLQDLEKSHNA